MITGLDEVTAALKKFNLSMDTVTDNAVRITALDILNKATKSIKEVSPGRQVPRGKEFHTISLPGDAPNSDRGGLITHIHVLHNRGSQIAEVGTNLPYGATLETTMNRPWLVPAKDAAEDNFRGNIKAAIQAAINKVIV